MQSVARPLPFRIERAAALDSVGESHGEPTGDKHYVVGRFRAWKRTPCSSPKMAFDGAAKAYILCLPASKTMETDAAAGQFPTMRTRGILCDLSQFEQLMRPEHGSYLVLAFEKSALVQQIRELLDSPLTEDVEFDGFVDLTTVSGARLSALGNLVWNCIDVPEQDRLPSVALERLFQTLMILLLEAVPNNYLPRLSGRPVSPAVPWRVKRAIEYMHANLSETITISAIAREVGTSVRALQSAFQRFKGISPLVYLRAIRLEAARKALLEKASIPPISDVARNAGFAHMGRFAAAYFEAYGETPSETARKR